jgi:triosephosphate isomerase
VVERQVRGALEGLAPAAYAKVVVAYEPVWAIGTGRTATPEQAGAMHQFIRKLMSSFGQEAGDVAVIYGGSVKPDLIDGLARTEGIEGALVGGASLEAGSFVQIVRGVASRATAG